MIRADSICLNSLIRPFLNIGTSLVRLEDSVTHMADFQSGSTSGTSHATAAALSTFLIWVKQEIAALRYLAAAASSTTPLALATLLSPLLSTLMALLVMFHTPLDRSPPYALIALSTPKLLSMLHDTLQYHIYQSLVPPLLTQITLAWLFDRAMESWWNKWQQWVGVLVHGKLDDDDDEWDMIGIETRGRDGATEYIVSPMIFAFVEFAGANDMMAQLHTAKLPTFLPRSVAVAMFESGRSLRLLKQACPLHPLARASPKNKSIDSGLCWKGDHAAV